MYLQKRSLLTNNLIKSLLIVVALFLVRYFFAVFVFYFFPSYIWNESNQNFVVSLPNFYYGFKNNPAMSLVNLWGKWDTSNYINLAQNGYTPLSESSIEPPNWVFFPAYPYILKLVAALFSGINSFAFMVSVSVILSNLFFIAALVILNLFIKKFFSIDHVQSVFFYLLFLFFPGSYFFTLGYTESLFLLLSLLAVYFAADRRFLLSGVFVGLTSITRVQGLLLIPVFIYCVVYVFLKERISKEKLLIVWNFLVGLFLSLFPIFLFLTYLSNITGDFFTPFSAQKYFGNSGFFPFRYFVDYLKLFIGSGLGNFLINAHSLCVLVLVFFWFVLGYSVYEYIKNRNYTYIDNLLFVYAFIYLFFTSGLSLGVSVFRYLSVCFPLFLLPIRHFRYFKSLIVINVVLVLFIMLQFLFYMFFVLNISAYGF